MLKRVLVLLGLLLTPPAFACSDTIPAIATANGLTNEFYCPDLTQTSTYDVNNTKAPGFGLYINTAWPDTAQPSFWVGRSPLTAPEYTINGTGLTLTPTVTTNGAELMMSTAPANNTQGFVGTAFTAPFYLQITWTCTGSANGGSVALWFFPQEYFVGGTTNTYLTTELDMVDQVTSCGNPGISALHDWTWHGGAATNDLLYASGSFVSSTSGVMVLPPPGASTGTIEFVHNGTGTDTCSYSATTVPSCTGGGSFTPPGPPSGSFSHTAAAGPYFLMLNAGGTQSLHVTNIQAWGPPLTPGNPFR